MVELHTGCRRFDPASSTRGPGERGRPPSSPGPFIVRRYEAASGGPAVLVETGEAFELLAERRSREAAAA